MRRLFSEIDSIDRYIAEWIVRSVDVIPVLGAVVALFSNAYFWVPLLSIVLLYLCFWRRPYRWALFGCCLLTLLLTDQLSGVWIKPWIARPRPMGGGFSFPSSHVTNVVGQVWIWSRFYPKGRWAMVAAASLVGLSRVYLHRHWPSDVVAGAILGFFIGYSVLWFARIRGWVTPTTS